MKTVCVILVNYNGRKYNDKCISSILNSTIADDIQIIVVDNASTDGSAEEMCLKWGNYEKFNILCLNDNFGFAKANNIGIVEAINQGYQYLLLLNNDTEIMPDTIEKMVRAMEEKEAIIVPKIYYYEEKKKIWYAGGKFSKYIKKAKHIGENKLDKGQFKSSEFCDFANGCCILISSSIINKIGLLDERFFLYYEDTEYSMRALSNGIKIWYCAEAVVYHKVNGATGGNNNPVCAYYIARNWLLCNSLHLGKNYNLFKIYFFLNRLTWIIIWTVKGKKESIKMTRQGIEDYKKQNWGKWNLL